MSTITSALIWIVALTTVGFVVVGIRSWITRTQQHLQQQQQQQQPIRSMCVCNVKVTNAFRIHWINNSRLFPSIFHHMSQSSLVQTDENWISQWEYKRSAHIWTKNANCKPISGWMFFFPINLSKLRSCSTTIKTNKIETIFYESLVFFRVCIKWIMHLERLTQTGLPIFVFCFSLEWLNSISLNFVFWILHIFISFRNFCAYMHFVWGNSFFSIWLTSYF